MIHLGRTHSIQRELLPRSESESVAIWDSHWTIQLGHNKQFNKQFNALKENIQIRWLLHILCRARQKGLPFYYRKNCFLTKV